MNGRKKLFLLTVSALGASLLFLSDWSVLSRRSLSESRPQLALHSSLQQCDNNSILHLGDNFLPSETTVLQDDYEKRLRLYHAQVLATKDPGMETIRANERSSAVFVTLHSAKTHVKMSVWNNETSISEGESCVTPDEVPGFQKEYRVEDLPDGDYFAFTKFFPANYGHFLHDHLPSIAHAKASFPPSTKLLLYNNENSWKRVNFIDREFARDRVIWIEDHVIYRVAKGSISVNKRSHIRHILERFWDLRNWIMEKLPTQYVEEESRTIIYYSRDSRDTHGRTFSPLNEAKIKQRIVEKMKEHGRKERFVVFDGQQNGKRMQLKAQFNLFRTASVVIGPHGSGLANILWLRGSSSCEDRPKVLEFLVQPRHVDIQSGGAFKTYCYLYGFPGWTEYHHMYYDTNAKTDDLRIDMETFGEALDSILSTTEPNAPSRADISTTDQ